MYFSNNKWIWDNDIVNWIINLESTRLMNCWVKFSKTKHQVEQKDKNSRGIFYTTALHLKSNKIKFEVDTTKNLYIFLFFFCIFYEYLILRQFIVFTIYDILFLKPSEIVFNCIGVFFNHCSFTVTSHAVAFCTHKYYHVIICCCQGQTKEKIS